MGTMWSHRLSFGAPATRGAPVFAAFLDHLLLWRERAVQRRRLGGLDDHLLKDLGLSRADVERERGKWFWQP